MKRFMVLVTVVLLIAAMLVFAGPVSAQGSCQAFGHFVSGVASSPKADSPGAFGVKIISEEAQRDPHGSDHVSEAMRAEHELLC